MEDSFRKVPLSIKRDFISQADVDEAKKNNPDRKDEVYDPRTLYERLSEARRKKEEELEEASKFSNAIHKIDDEEYQYMNMLLKEEKRKELETKTEVEKELQVFRKQVLARSAVEPPVLLGDASASDKSKKVVVTKKRDFQKHVLMNAVKRRKKEEQNTKDCPSPESPLEVPSDSISIRDNKVPPKKDKGSTTTPLTALVAYSGDSESEEEEDH